MTTPAENRGIWREFVALLAALFAVAWRVALNVLREGDHAMAPAAAGESERGDRATETANAEEEARVADAAAPADAVSEVDVELAEEVRVDAVPGEGHDHSHDHEGHEHAPGENHGGHHHQHHEGARGELKLDGEHYFNRELSTLEFNCRVLALAENPNVPLLERVKFLAIFSSNMDELFEVRVSGLKGQLAAGLSGTAPDGIPVSVQLRAIRKRTLELVKRRTHVLLDEVIPSLAQHGIRISDWSELEDSDRRWLEQVFEERIFPVLTPLAVDPGHPFPYISNLSLNLAVMVSDPVAKRRRFARVKVPPLLPGFLPLPDGERFVPVEQIISAHLGVLFPGMVIESSYPFRVTRNADQSLDGEADDLLAAVETDLRRRRFSKAVRLEVDLGMTDEVRSLLVRELDLDDDDVYSVRGPLDIAGLWGVYGLDAPELKYEPFSPTTPPRLAERDDEPVDIFGVIRSGDLLVQLPYESFAASVEAFIHQAAHDPDVLAIKQTLYRTSGNSPIVRSLIQAAEQGKQVAALVELKARGDEAANIGWARALEEQGVHVVYGLVGLKTHSKTALVVRQEADGIRRYCHVGTGNYNSTTARLYEDLGLLTCEPEVGADLTELFNYLTGYSHQGEYRRLIVAPAGLRPRMLELIERETRLMDVGRIIWKLNNLVDPQIIDALYAASQAGVQIDIVARANCCLRPGVKGLSENIRVRSIVGRWLEHSRIYYFGSGYDHGILAAPGASSEDLGHGHGHDHGQDHAGEPGQEFKLLLDGEVFVEQEHAHEHQQGHDHLVPHEAPGGEYLIGSGDMMERNLDRRVEALIPVTDQSLRDRLAEILTIELSDDELAWELGPDGAWVKVPTVNHIDAQKSLQDLALARARRGRERATDLAIGG